MYFVKNNRTDCFCERHRVNIPTLGWVRIKEKGYLPTTKDGYVIKSGTVSMRAGRYYVSVLVEVPDPPKEENRNEGIGIDLGIKSFAVLSDGTVYQNINKRANIQKQKLRVQKLHQRINQIRTDYINKTIAEMVKTKPSYITIEDLNVKGMMKNRHLSKATASQKFYEFRTRLQGKCAEKGIELRIADRWYPSSRRCHNCGQIRKDLKLSNRVYQCSCGYCEDRDLNAALNLRDVKTYQSA